MNRASPSTPAEPAIEMIPMEQITVVNPRSRGQAKFKQIVSNISRLGLKKPIVVARRPAKDGIPQYDLVCGQGRMEAFIALGHQEIPAIVVEMSKEEWLIHSLVENIARRYPAPMELIREIERLREEG